jgi:hypothetical protein
VSSRRHTILAYHAIIHLSNDPNWSATSPRTSPRRFKYEMLSLKRQEPARSLRAGGAEGFENASASATSVIKPTTLEAASALTPRLS